jgi:hypothetical protein
MPPGRPRRCRTSAPPKRTIAQLRRSHAHRCRTRRRAHSCNRLSLIGPARSYTQAVAAVQVGLV